MFSRFFRFFKGSFLATRYTRQGAADYAAGKRRTDNPHHDGTPPHREWDIGWDAAHELDFFPDERIAR